MNETMKLDAQQQAERALRMITLPPDLQCVVVVVGFDGDPKLESSGVLVGGSSTMDHELTRFALLAAAGAVLPEAASSDDDAPDVQQH